MELEAKPQASEKPVGDEGPEFIAGGEVSLERSAEHEERAGGVGG